MSSELLTIAPFLRCEILRSESDLERIGDEWRALHARARRTPASDYDRFRVWWRTVGESLGPSRLHVVTGWRGGRLVAVLPLVVMHIKGVLRLLREPDGLMYDCDVLCENAADALPLWQAARASPHYDFARIRGVHPETASLAVLKGFAFPGDDLDSFYLDIKWTSGEAWLASLSGNARGNFNRCSRRLREKGALSYHVCREGTVPLDLVEQMVDHKVAWVHARGKRGLFHQREIHAYFRDWTTTAARQGELFLAWLDCGGTAIACNLGIIDQGMLRAYFWTHDPAWKQFSPGNILMMRTICWAIDHGLDAIDLIYSSSSESEKNFKRKYCNRIQHCHEFTFHHSLRGRLLQSSVLSLLSLSRKISISLRALRER